MARKLEAVAAAPEEVIPVVADVVVEESNSGSNKPAKVEEPVVKLVFIKDEHGRIRQCAEADVAQFEKWGFTRLSKK